MINIFIGYQNSGKTLSMTYFLYLYYLKGYKIFSNYNLGFPHEKLNKQMLLDFAQSDKQFSKCIIAIDEIHVYFDSRSSGSKANKIFSYLVLQSSKRDVHIFGTTQEFMNIEVRIRSHCNIKIFCNRYFKKNNDEYIEVKSSVRHLTEQQNENLYIRCLMMTKRIVDVNLVIDKKYIYIKAKKLFKLYDTKELINFS